MVSQVRILGPIEVELGPGQSARIPRGRTLSLLALLLVHRGAIVPLDRIVDELWEGDGPRNARNAVQVVASRLRAVVGEDVVISEARGYGVRAPVGALDADRFEDGFRRGGELLARGDPGQASVTLHDALALWRGEALADVGDEGFAQPEIARLEDLRLACLADRIDADLACGRHAEMVGELEALVRQHPLRERLRGQLMLALYRTGRQADALEAYRSAYEALVDGLGIEPSPELRALEAAILRQDMPAPAPPPRRPVLAPDVRRRVTCVLLPPGAGAGGPGVAAHPPRAPPRGRSRGLRPLRRKRGRGARRRRAAGVRDAGGARGRRAAGVARGDRAAVGRAAARARRRDRRRRRAADRRGARGGGATRARRGRRGDPDGRGDLAPGPPRGLHARPARRRL